MQAFADDLAELASACQQLLADSATEITETTVEKYYSGRIETNAFKVADMAIAGQQGDALVLLRHALHSGADPVPVVAARPMRRPVKIGRPLVERDGLPSRLGLPVREGQVVGEVRVYDRKRLLGRTPLIAAEARDDPGFLERTGWYAGRTLDHIGGWFR